METTPLTIERSVALLPLSRRKQDPLRSYALLDPADWPKVEPYRWARQSKGYATASIRQPDGTRKNYLLHRWLLQPPRSRVVDHRNGKPLDCRRENIRIVTPNQNAQHRPNVHEPYRGTYLDSQTGKWRAWCRSGKKGKIYNGSYETREQAAQAAADLRNQAGYLDA
jgi:hypothetical protein